MSKATVNGEKPHSQTLQHVTSYPLIADAMGFYKSNSMGAKSIQLFNQAYATFAEPFVPYLQTPYSVVKPYLEKVDSLGNSSLDTVDNHFPVVKQTNFEQLKGHAFTTASFPFKVAGQTKDYVFTTYGDEYKKCGGDGVVASGKAVLTTELRIAVEALQAFGDWVGPKTQGLQKDVNNLASKGQENVESLKAKSQSDFESIKSQSQEKATKAKKTAADKKDEALS